MKMRALSLLVCWSLHARVLVPQKQYWRYQAFQEPTASTFWAYYTGRSATKGFNCDGKKSCSALADIYFNKANFVTSQVFPLSSTLFGSVPFAPRYTYTEQGIDIGYYGSREINSKWSWGGLVELPVKRITMKARNVFGKNPLETIEFFGEPLSNLVQQTQTTSGDQTYTTYAYRLDFLSKLPYACTGIGSFYPMVVYHDTDFLNLPVTISNVDTTDANNNPVTVLHSPPGTVPPQPFEVLQAQATVLPVLHTDGSQTGSDARERFSTGNYTPLASLPENQEQWWVVPTVVPVAGGQTTVFPARVIRDHVDEVLACLGAQALNVFSAAGINFCSQKPWGAGDLVTQLFVTYDSQSWWGMRLRGGIIFPTAQVVHQVTDVFAQPIGNNGHYEFQVGSEFLMNGHDISAMIYFLSSHACRKTEVVPAASVGSCIKNIGLPSQAIIGWNSVTAGLLANITTGYCKKVNLLLGYQAYIKSHDSTCYATRYGQDPLGNQVLLDARVLKNKTRRQLHTLQAQLQYNFWRHMRLDGGIEYACAGNSAPALLDWNLGVSLLF